MAACHQRLRVGGCVVQANDVLLEKPCSGAFQGTDLEMILLTRDIATAIISGIATNVFCETTAREAMARDLRVLLLSAGMVTVGDVLRMSVRFAVVSAPFRSAG